MNYPCYYGVLNHATLFFYINLIRLYKNNHATLVYLNKGMILVIELIICISNILLDNVWHDMECLDSIARIRTVDKGVQCGLKLVFQYFVLRITLEV